ncbi:hypothetical protein BB559_000931 [Furculomyces boomerangus]|uniref:Uncharacterized protein n=1 Tax=Furculomyces boomerangus TaxID=61424 RepID=A0A2T9Z3K2_9FUNG|nr:hypothetical protein BB559_000931 [Furculomyces boomerangus]
MRSGNLELEHSGNFANMSQAMRSGNLELEHSGNFANMSQAMRSGNLELEHSALELIRNNAMIDPNIQKTQGKMHNRETDSDDESDVSEDAIIDNTHLLGTKKRDSVKIARSGFESGNKNHKVADNGYSSSDSDSHSGIEMILRNKGNSKDSSSSDVDVVRKQHRNSVYLAKKSLKQPELLQKAQTNNAKQHITQDEAVQLRIPKSKDAQVRKTVRFKQTVSIVFSSPLTPNYSRKILSQSIKSYEYNQIRSLDELDLIVINKDLNEGKSVLRATRSTTDLRSLTKSEAKNIEKKSQELKLLALEYSKLKEKSKKRISKVKPSLKLNIHTGIFGFDKGSQRRNTAGVDGLGIQTDENRKQSLHISKSVQDLFVANVQQEIIRKGNLKISRVEKAQLKNEDNDEHRIERMNQQNLLVSRSQPFNHQAAGVSMGALNNHSSNLLEMQEPPMAFYNQNFVNPQMSMYQMENESTISGFGQYPISQQSQGIYQNPNASFTQHASMSAFNLSTTAQGQMAQGHYLYSQPNSSAIQFSRNINTASPSVQSSKHTKSQFNQPVGGIYYKQNSQQSTQKTPNLYYNQTPIDNKGVNYNSFSGKPHQITQNSVTPQNNTLRTSKSNSMLQKGPVNQQYVNPSAFQQNQIAFLHQQYQQMGMPNVPNSKRGIYNIQNSYTQSVNGNLHGANYSQASLLNNSFNQPPPRSQTQQFYNEVKGNMQLQPHQQGFLQNMNPMMLPSGMGSQQYEIPNSKRASVFHSQSSNKTNNMNNRWSVRNTSEYPNPQ